MKLNQWLKLCLKEDPGPGPCLIASVELTTGGGVQIEIFKTSYVIFSLSCGTRDRGGVQMEIFQTSCYFSLSC